MAIADIPRFSPQASITRPRHWLRRKTPAKSCPAAHTIISDLNAWLLGTFRGVSHKHLDRYLKEFTYRLNRRWNEDKPSYYLTRQAVEGKPLPYHRLIAEPIG